MSNSASVSTIRAAPAAAAPPRPSLRSLAIRGSLWTIAGFGGGQALRLGSNIVLAWLLFPEAFGLMLLVNVFMQGLQMFSDIGIGPSIIQNKRGNDQEFLNTAWTIQVIRGFVLWFMACLLAWPIAWLYAQNDPLAWKLVLLIPVAGFMAVLSGFYSTSLFTLNRELAMGRLMMIQIGSQIAGIVVMIAWAIVHPSVWALVVGGLATFAVKLVMSHTVIPGPRNRFTWNWQCARALWSFGKWIFVSTAVTFLAMQADRVLLGNLIPMHMLGVYGFGLMLALLPREVVHHLTGMVLFPALSQHGRTNRETLPEKTHMARSAIVPIAGVMLLGVALLAPIFFELLYPQVYHAAGWMAQLICISVWFSILTASSDRALLAIGNSRVLAATNLISLLVTVPAALLGFHVFGLPGFILGHAGGTLAALLVVQVSMHRHGISVYRQDVLFTAVLVLLAAAGVGGAWLMPQWWAGIPDLASSIAVAAIVLVVGASWALRSAVPVLFKP